jgi:hypothetical protein
MITHMRSRKTLSLWVAIAVAAVTLSACASSPEGDGDLPPTDSPASAAAPTTPSPTATPTMDSADPAAWVIDFDSIGPVGLGQSIPDATAALSAFTAQAEPSCPPLTRVELGAEGPSIWLTEDPLQQLVLIRTDSSETVTVTPRTAEGVGIGSSVDEVTAAYPDAQVSEDMNSTVYSVGDGPRWINFSTLDGVVDTIVVRDSPTVQSEYCG